MSIQPQVQSSTEEIQALADLSKDFASKELMDKKEKNDHYPFGELFVGSIKNAGEVGFYGVNLPATFGGVGMGETALASILENLSAADASMAGVIFTNAAAMSLGIMKGSFVEGLQYTKDRFQGGRQIINWSEVRMLLANMAIEVQIGQSCLGWACHQLDAKAFGWEKAARAAAIHVAEMACRTTTDGVQVLGGNGYMKDYGQEKRMRDAKQVQCLLGMAPVRKINFVDQIIKESE